MIGATGAARVFIATRPVDFRKGIDGLAGICRQQLQRDPMNGWAFVFRNRKGTAVKVLVYDGQGFLHRGDDVEQVFPLAGEIGEEMLRPLHHPVEAGGQRPQLVAVTDVDPRGEIPALDAPSRGIEPADRRRGRARRFPDSTGGSARASFS